jgi:hypothetical protein
MRMIDLAQRPDLTAEAFLSPGVSGMEQTLEGNLPAQRTLS